METALRCMVSQNPSSWSQDLLWVEYAHNILTSSATGLSPFQCAYGYQPPLWKGKPLALQFKPSSVAVVEPGPVLGPPS